MELMAGYIRSDIGVIPEDWKVLHLGDLATIRDGTHQTPKYQVSGVPFYSVEHITSDDFSNTKFISEAEHEFLSRNCKIEMGDILMTRIGSIGECKLIDWDVRASFYVSLALLKIKEASANYIAQYSNFPAFKREVELHSLQHATPKKINLGPISHIRIALPPSKLEQEEIAKVLNDFDSLIKKLDLLITKKKNIKEAAMYQLLTGKTRLAGYGGQWKSANLGDISKIKTGSKNNEDKVKDGAYPFFVRSANVERINTFSHECEAILVPGEGQVGSIFHYINGRFDVHQRVYAITEFADEVLGRFVHLYMSQHFGAWAMQNTVKATVDSLRLPTFQKFKISFPQDIREQNAIAKTLEDISQDLALLMSRRNKTIELKKALMQDLFSGKKRLI
jgi:type I restriction enzyme S subunit